MYCEYYQAMINVRYTWFIGGVFRNDDTLAFERTMEGKNDVLEFFVPLDQEEEFLFVINDLVQQGYVYSIEKLPNRLKPNVPL